MMNSIAAQTLAVCDAGGYSIDGQFVSIADELRAAREGTLLHTPGEVRRLPWASGAGRPRVEVTGETTTQAIARLQDRGDVLALNFASARNPGGGFLRGAKAQEEDLCRQSGLFRCLETQPRYYEANRAHGGCLYTDHAIWSPRVPFFRDDRFEFTKTPTFASVLTMPAPNAAELNERPHNAGALEATFMARARAVLQLARLHGHRTLVLGAWGCGAFRNPPELAATAFASALEGTSDDFDLVVFAVWERRGPGPNYAAFQARLGS